MDFTLQYWTLLESSVLARCELHIAVEKRLGEESIEIPFPQRDFNLRGFDPPVLRPAGEGQPGERPDSPTQCPPHPASRRNRMAEYRPGVL